MTRIEKYKDFQAQDFFWDAYFRMWVTHPQEESDDFFKNFLVQYPLKGPVITEAAAMVRSLQPEEYPLAETELIKEIGSIMTNIALMPGANIVEHPEAETARLVKRNKWMYPIWGIAASLALVAGIWWMMQSNKAWNPSNGGKAYAQQKQEADTPLKELINNSDSVKQCILPDSTIVLLEPNARLSIPYSFGTQQSREVYLSGKAFFDVAHRLNQPFYIYANEVVTRVLGTSFQIFADPTNGKVDVKVRSGKVQVFERNANFSNKAINGVVLTANHQVTYEPQEKALKVSLVEKPLPVEELIDSSVKSQVSPILFSYERALLGIVIKDLEKKYGVNIEVEHPDILHCSFSGDISNGNLFEQLNMICIATNASYHVNGVTILISGTGCK